MAISLPDARMLSDDILQALRLRRARLRVGLHRSRRREPARGLARDREPLVVGLRHAGTGRAAAGAVRTSPRLRTPAVRPASQPHPRTPRQPQPQRPGHPRPPVEPPCRARPDPQGVRHRPGRADRGRRTSAVGAIPRSGRAATLASRTPRKYGSGWKRPLRPSRSGLGRNPRTSTGATRRGRRPTSTLVTATRGKGKRRRSKCRTRISA